MITINQSFDLKLKTKIVFGEMVQPTKLPTDPDFSLPPGSKVKVMGWGAGFVSTAIQLANYSSYSKSLSTKESQSSEKWPKLLQKLSIETVDDKKCKRMMKHSYLALARNIVDHSLCAGGEGGRDACQGDSGGPLVTDDDKVRHQYDVEISKR